MTRMTNNSFLGLAQVQVLVLLFSVLLVPFDALCYSLR